MLGIIVKYRKNDSTLAAISLARQLDATGRKYTILRHDWRARAVDPVYDNKVKPIRSIEQLFELSHLIWLIPGDEDVINPARARGIRSTLYTSLDMISPWDERVMDRYTHIVLPTTLQAVQLKERWKLKNIAVISYDSGLPFTRKQGNVEPDKIKLFFSLYGSQLHSVELSSFSLLASILDDFSNVYVTIATSKGLAPCATTELKKLHKHYGDRWNVLWNCPWYQQTILFGEHDLTIWPSRTDGFGIVGLTSLAAGTPVVSWNASPFNETLAIGRNSLLVTAAIDSNWIGVAKVLPDYKEFGRILRWLLGKPDALATLRKYTSEQLTEKRIENRKGWSALLPGS